MTTERLRLLLVLLLSLLVFCITMTAVIRGLNGIRLGMGLTILGAAIGFIARPSIVRYFTPDKE